MAFWRGETLLAAGTAPGSNLIVPFNADQIDCNAYNLRMGGQYYKTADYEQNASTLQKRILLAPHESFLIPSGQFAFLLSKESISVPKDAMAFISMRTRIKFQGLINVSGFHVDPGYTGHLVYAVYNASPSSIQLCENDLVFKIWFCSLDHLSGGNFVKDPSDGLHEITNEMVRGMNREMISVRALSREIESLKFNMKVQATIFGFAAALLLALVITGVTLTLRYGAQSLWEAINAKSALHTSAPASDAVGGPISQPTAPPPVNQQAPTKDTKP